MHTRQDIYFKYKYVAAKYELPLVPARVQSISPRTQAIDRLSCLANTRTGQSGRRVPPVPIRTPEWSSRLSGQRRILFTQPCVTPEHERHLVISFRRLYFPWFIFSPHLTVFGKRAILIGGGGGLGHGGGFSPRNSWVCTSTPRVISCLGRAKEIPKCRNRCRDILMASHFSFEVM